MKVGSQRNMADVWPTPGLWDAEALMGMHDTHTHTHTHIHFPNSLNLKISVLAVYYITHLEMFDT